MLPGSHARRLDMTAAQLMAAEELQRRVLSCAGLEDLAEILRDYPWERTRKAVVDVGLRSVCGFLMRKLQWPYDTVLHSAGVALMMDLDREITVQDEVMTLEGEIIEVEERMHLFDSNVLAAMLQNDTFLAPLDAVTLRALEAVILTQKGTEILDDVHAPTSAICTWLQRIIGVDNASVKFSSRLVASVRWWNSSLERCAEEPRQDILQWVLQVYMHSLLELEEVHFDKEFVAVLAGTAVYPLLKSSNPRVLRVLLGCLQQSLAVVPADFAMMAAFPQGKHVSAVEQAGMAEMHHFFLEEILHAALDGLIAGTFGYSGVEALQSDADFTPTVGPLLGGEFGQVWCHLVAWHFNHLPYRCMGFDWSAGACVDRTILHDQLQNTVDVAIVALKAAAERLFERSKCTLGFVMDCTNVPEHILKPALDSISMPKASDIAQELCELLMQAKTKLEQLVEIFETLDCKGFSSTCKQGLQNIGTTSLADLESLLWLNGDAGTRSPLPQVATASAEWLHAASSVSLFLHFWSSTPKGLDVAGRITHCMTRLLNLYEGVKSGNATFSELAAIPIDCWSYGSIRFLSTTGQSVASLPDASACMSWELLSCDDSEVDHFVATITEWVAYCRIKSILPNVTSLRELLSTISKGDALTDCEQWCQALLELKVEVESVPSAVRILKELSHLTSIVSTVPLELSGFETKLLSALMSHSELIEWLKAQPDDNDFVSSLEIAMGKPQMECPARLWRPGTGGEPGGPDEGVLSMLRSLRSSLYEYIYRAEEKFEESEDLLRVFTPLCPLPPPPGEPRENYDAAVEKLAHVISAVEKCGSLVADLKQLVTAAGVDAAISRLSCLLAEESRATFLCGNAPLSDDILRETALTKIESSHLQELSGTPTVSLVMMFAQDGHIHRQTLPEIQEFHSGLMLSGTGSGKGRELSKISIAIEQFSETLAALTSLKLAVSSLQAAGHLSFRHFLYKMPFATNAAAIRALVESLDVILEQWREHMFSVRRGPYARVANLLPVARIWLFGDAFSLLENGHADSASTLLSALLHFISPSLLCDPENLLSFRSSARKSWKESHVGLEPEEQSSLHCRATRHLDRCLVALDDALLPLLARLSTKPLKLMIPSTSDVTLEPGLHVITCDEGTLSVYECVVSAFAMRGILPTRCNVLLCRSDTTQEELECFLLRCCSAGKSTEASVPELFSIASVEKLSFDLQRLAVDMLQGTISGVEDKSLVVVADTGSSQGSSHCHFLAEFSNCRRPFTPLDRSTLQTKVGEMLHHARLPSATVYHSLQPGAGKSFQIRTEAHFLNAAHIHVPVVSASFLLTRLIEGVRSILTTSDATAGKEGPDLSGLAALLSEESVEECDMFPILYHFDVTDTATRGGDVSAILFELLFFNGVSDTTQMRYKALPPNTACLAFELSCGTLMERLPILQVLPHNLVNVTPESFCVTREKLELGMSSSEFENMFQSSAAEYQSGGEGDAFERLVYVCLTLDILDQNQGRYPYTHERPDASHGDSNLRSSLRSSLSSLRLSASISGAYAALERPESAERYLSLLLKATKQNPKYPSLWCLWNFVNLLYWQLRGVNSSNSVLNKICQPFAGEPFSSIERKGVVKGNLIQFLVETSAEIATRQIKEFDIKEPNRVQAVNFRTNPKFNNIYVRCDYDHNGKPCFEADGLYLYWRTKQNAWVLHETIAERGPCQLMSSNGDSALPPGGTWHLFGDSKATNGWAETVVDKSVKFTTSPGNSASNCQGTYTAAGMISGRRCYRLAEAAVIYYVSPLHSWVIARYEDGDKAIVGVFQGDIEIQGRVRCNAWPTEQYGSYIVSVDVIEQEKFREIPLWKLRVVKLCTPAQHVKDVKDLLKLIELDPCKLFEDMVKWNDSTHDSLLFSNATGAVKFLTKKAAAMRERMHPYLMETLDERGFDIGGGLEKFGGSDHHATLAALTGVKNSKDPTSNFLGGTFCLTGDCLQKMLALYTRVRSGVPVVLMGECGCGKTHLIKFLCRWLQAQLFVLDIHGGTSEADILAIFAKASKAAQEDENGKKREVFVLLDEVNTCPHMGLLNDIICHRSLLGMDLPCNIRILAALNPYRKRTAMDCNKPGLVFKLHDEGSGESTLDTMADLVYKVHPIPLTMLDFIFDFGALEPLQEKSYIESMVNSMIPERLADHDVRSLISELINVSQRFIRQVEKDDSSVSLRDVKRCLKIMLWFAQRATPKASRAKKAAAAGSDPPLSPLAASVVMGLAFVYCYRLNDARWRKEYWERLQSRSTVHGWFSFGCKPFKRLLVTGAFEKVLEGVQKQFGRQFALPPGIALNTALKENLFITVICILNQIPVFLVGKPGSSKTLTMQIISSNLQGAQSDSAFWRRFPAVYVFQYQCSPMSDSHSIQYQFDIAVRYQKHAQNCVTVLLLDEVGLAEHSPDMPLKVLHGMLVDPPIAIVGLSNWVLDPAKMNRAVCVQRMDPSRTDITNTGTGILSKSGKTTSLDKTVMKKLGTAYHKVFTMQSSKRSFVGMRDFYCLVKALDAAVMGRQGRVRTYGPQLLVEVLSRNFGGRSGQLRKTIDIFLSTCFPDSDVPPLPPVRHLIESNLADNDTRNLMVLNHNAAALGLLFGLKVLPVDTLVLVASDFPGDKHEFYLVQQIREIKHAMAEGRTVLLVNHDNIYEALYDVLNQRYLYRSDPSHPGTFKKMLRLAIGSKSQLCAVQDGFKIVVAVGKQHALEKLDLPLLNRFEKQQIKASEMLGENQLWILSEITAWVASVAAEMAWCQSSAELFCGYHKDVASAAVLGYSHFNDAEAGTDRDRILKRLKLALARTAYPLVAFSSPTIGSLEGFSYAEECGSISMFLRSLRTLATSEIARSAAEEHSGLAVGLDMVLTHSPLAHFTRAIPNQFGFVSQSVHFAEFTTELQFRRLLEEYFRSSSHDLLVIQCDPAKTPPTLLAHAQQMCASAFNAYLARAVGLEAYRKCLLLLLHLPPSTRHRRRDAAVDLSPPWRYSFVDDARLESDVSDFCSIMTSPPSQLLSGEFSFFPSLEHMVKTRYQFAFSRYCSAAGEDASSESGALALEPPPSLNDRLLVIVNLIKDTRFVSLICSSIRGILVAHEQDGKAPLHVQFVLANAQLRTGNYRQNLIAAVEMIVDHCFASVLLKLDTDFNLMLACQTGSERDDISSRLWWNMVSLPSIFDPEALPRAVKLDYESVTSHLASRAHGSHGLFSALFPFSGEIVATLNTSDVRESIAALSLASGAADEHSYEQFSLLEKQREHMEAFVRTLLGDKLTSMANAVTQNYVHDFLVLNSKPCPNVAFGMVSLLFQALSEAVSMSGSTGASFLRSIASVHVMFWYIDPLLADLCALLSAMTRPQQEDAAKTVMAVVAAARNSGPSPCCNMVASIFAEVLHVFFESKWDDLRAVDSTAKNPARVYFQWMQQLPMLVAPVSGLFHYTLSSVSARGIGDPFSADLLPPSQHGVTLAYLRQSWVTISIAKILLETIALGLTGLRMVKVADGTAAALLTGRHRDPFSRAGFLAITDAAYQLAWTAGIHSESDSSGFFDGFFQALVSDVLFPAASSVFQAPLESSLLCELSAITDQREQEAKPWIVSLACRRILAQKLFDLDGSDFEWMPQTLEGLQLMVELIEDRLPRSKASMQQFPQNWGVISGCDLTDVLSLSRQELVSVIEATRGCLATLCDAFSSGELLESAEELPKVLEIALCDEESQSRNSAVVTVLRAIRERGGEAGLVDFLKKRAGTLSWLPARAAEDMPTSKVPDLLWLCSRKHRQVYEDCVGNFLSYQDDVPFASLLEKCTRGMGLSDPSACTGGGVCPEVLQWSSVASISFRSGGKSSDNGTHEERRSALIRAAQKWIDTRKEWNSPTQRQLYQWILSGCKPYEPDYLETVSVSDLPRSTQLQLQVGIFAVLQGLQTSIFEKSKSWIWHMLQNTEEMEHAHIPGYKGSDFADLMAAMGHTGWYKCVNGHLYTVGNCTYPMEQSRCPECGSIIGGRMHVTRKGTTRLDAKDLDAQSSIPGYPKSEKQPPTTVSESTGRLPPLEVAMFRFLLHCVLWVGMSMSSALRKRISAFVGFDSSSQGVRDAADHVRYRCHTYWVESLRLSHMEPDSLATHLVHMLEAMDASVGGHLRTAAAKGEVEMAIACLPRPGMLVPKGFEESLQKQSRTLCVAALGDELWASVEKSPHDDSRPATPLDVLWLDRKASSMDSFVTGLRSFVKANDLALLKVIVAREEELTIVKSLSAILAWHRVLFTSLAGTKLSREAASSLANEEVVERYVPKTERTEAYAILDRYCDAFNIAFPHVHFLYECNRNPFLGKDGQVDLSGGGDLPARMSRKTPVSFSLPSMIQGDADAAGLCTIQLITILQNAHTQLLEQAREVHLGRFHHVRGRDAASATEGLQVASLNYMTPTKLVAQMLIDYDRRCDLEPLLSAFRADGADAYDYRAIEAALGRTLLADKQPLSVVVHHFPYAGELKRKGKLSSLRLRVPQQQLPKSVYQGIFGEVDTQHHASQLMAHVEVAVNFLTSVGGGGGAAMSVDSDMRLEEYILRALLVDSAEWEELTTTNISRHVRLCHVQSLVMCLEEVTHGSPLDAVDLMYRERIPATLEREILVAKPHLELQGLLSTFHDLLVDQLSTNGFPATESLKQYLTFADFDLEEETWYQQHFPDGLRLAHAYETYHLLA